MTTSEPLRILIVAQDSADSTLLERRLARSGLDLGEVCRVDRLAHALEALRNCPFDIVLLDLRLPDSQGVQSVTKLQAHAPQVPIIVLGGCDDENMATQVVHMGAQDCLTEGRMQGDYLTHAVSYALERKRAELQLQATELRYRTIFENSAVAIIMADKEGKLCSWNRFAEYLLAVEGTELLGRDFLSLYPQSEWQRIQASRICGKGMRDHFETRMVRGDGEVIHVDISLSVVEDADGEVAGFIGLVQDITEHKRIHEILDHKQKNLEAIFDAAPVGMLLVNDQMRVVRANDAIRRMSRKGYPDIVEHDLCEALACIHSVKFTDPADPSFSCEVCSLRNMTHTALVWGQAVRGAEIRPGLSRNGEELRLWLSASIEPVHIDGSKHIVVALNDVTDRKRAEEERRDAMEMKSQFISTVSHELRTPLTSMREAVLIVLDEVAGKINQDQKHFLDIAKRNIDRLARLIDDVLDFQRLDAGKMKFDLRETSIGTTVEEAYATMEPQAAKSDVEITLDLETDLPPIVCDRDRIIQALTNLISNAIKFTPAGGRIAVSAHRRGEHLVLTVSDTGLGIPKEDLPKIFDRFYRVQRPGQEIKGTGLGLAIVSRIVVAHGGRVEVESEPGQGTTFTVLLPQAPGQTRAGLSGLADEHIESTLARE
jgi:PAS domain S-box-containing protein